MLKKILEWYRVKTHVHAFGKWGMAKTQIMPVCFGYVQLCYKRKCKSCGYVETTYSSEPPAEETD
jgi:hypothetical protein